MTNGTQRFICIGTQKAGTSWLHWNLFFHPETDIIEQKEFNYFWPVFDWRACLQNRVDSGFESWNGALRTLVTSAYHCNPRFNYRQYIQCLWPIRTPARYLKILTPRKGRKIGGDVCPVYTHAGIDRLREYYSVLSQSKRMIILRNPIERAWSQFRMASVTRKLGELDEEGMKREIDARCLAYSRYSEILDRWERAGLPLNVFFYEELCHDPVKFFRTVCEYLGITPLVEFRNSKVQEPIHVGRKLSMPDSVRAHLEQRLGDEIAYCLERYPNRWTRGWATPATERQVALAGVATGE